MPLAPIARRPAPRRSAQTRVNASVAVSPPVGGLNLRDPLPDMGALDAVIFENFIARTNGVEVRPGTSLFAGPLLGLGIGSPVRTMMSYVGRTSAQNALFACVENSIVAIDGGTSNLSVPGASSDGIWQYVNFLTPGGNFLVAVNNGGGYWTYDATGGWVKRVPTGAWPVTDRITSVTAWKNRLWFTFAQDPRAYYLDLNAIQGTAVAFDFGPQLQRGGEIALIANWTHDAGAGIDDFQVIVGSEGDVLVYQGYDPATIATYELKGAWYVGAVPVGNRFHADYKGDLLLVTEMGIVPISLLVNGQLSASAGSAPLTTKIQPEIQAQISRTLRTVGWEISLVPFLDVMVVQAPPENGVYMQWAMNLTTGAWSKFSGIPMCSSTMHEGEFYVGCPRATVLKAFVTGLSTDYNPIAQASATVYGDSQSSFAPVAGGTSRARFIQARLSFVGPQPPAASVRMNPDFRIDGVTNNPDPANFAGAQWDSAIWDAALWGDGLATWQRWYGLQGVGYYGGLRVRMASTPGTRWASAQVVAETGGPM